MRWFKHLTETRQDEKMARLVADGGHAAYGLWWMVLEIIARKMEKGSGECSVAYPVSKWAAELSLRPCNVRRSLATVVATGSLQMRDTGAAIELSAPNLLKYRDEWQSKLVSNSRARIQNTEVQKQKQNTDSASRAGKAIPPSLTEEERRLLEYQKSLPPITHEEQEENSHRVWAQIKSTPEGAELAEKLLKRGKR